MALPEKLNPSRRQVLIGAAVLVAFLIGLFLWQAFTAGFALRDARKDADRVQELITAGDFDGATRALEDLRDHADRAHNQTDGFLWDIGSKIPFFGKNLGAMQTVSAVLDTATTDNAPVALALNKALNEGTFRPVDGKINLDEVKRLTPEVDRAAASILEAGKDLDEIRSGSLLFPFNDIVEQLQEQFDSARSASRATATAFDLMPAMLGGNGPRNYLLIVQNPAEVRATGGLPGSVAILRAEGGRLTMGLQGSASDLKGFGGPVVELPKDTRAMYGTTTASDFRDINFNPDFPQVAQVAAVMAKRKFDVDVDGVLSVDPVAMAYVLAATGPVSVQGEQLRADNVITTLLNKVYVDNDPGVCGSDNTCIQERLARQDDFFESAAKTIFNAVMSGQGSQQTAIRGLGTSTNEHRVLLWAKDPAEQARLTGTAISGGLTKDSGSTPVMGLYLNDSTASKMDFYLQYRSSVTAIACRQKGAQDFRVTTSFKSTMPKNFSRLGISVLGTGDFAKQGDITFNARFYAPYGGQVTDLQVDGVPVSVTADKHFGREVAFLPVTVKPGQEIIVTALIRSKAGQDGNAVFNFTPGMVTPSTNGIKIRSACD